MTYFCTLGLGFERYGPTDEKAGFGNRLLLIKPVRVYGRYDYYVMSDLVGLVRLETSEPMAFQCRISQAFECR